MGRPACIGAALDQRCGAHMSCLLALRASQRGVTNAVSRHSLLQVCVHPAILSRPHVGQPSGVALTAPWRCSWAPDPSGHGAHVYSCHMQQPLPDTPLVLPVQAVVDLWDKVLDGYSDLAVVSEIQRLLLSTARVAPVHVRLCVSHSLASTLKLPVCALAVHPRPPPC